MSQLLAPEAPASAPKRRSWFAQHPVLTVVLALFLLSCLSRVYGDYREHQRRAPLRVVENALQVSGRHLPTITPALQERWSNGYDPTEAQVKRRTGATSHYAELLYLNRLAEETRDSMGERPERADRCYYFAVQPGGGPFVASMVSGFSRYCFDDSSRYPWGSSYVSAVR